MLKILAKKNIGDPLHRSKSFRISRALTVIYKHGPVINPRSRTKKNK